MVTSSPTSAEQTFLRRPSPPSACCCRRDVQTEATALADNASADGRFFGASNFYTYIARPRQLAVLGRDGGACAGIQIRAHRPCSHLQVDIPERDAETSLRDPRRDSRSWWTTTALLDPLAAIAGSPLGE